MSETLQGIIRGKTVAWTSDPRLEQGQRVEVVLRPTPPEQQARSAAGVLADVSGLDESLEEIQRHRKMARHRADSL